ncbi:AraC family transcriptional regulator [Paraburkholderia sp. ZP32-5]|uniref:AraC family transcriptional regulator n=1 Tax=Paraburkholderia sp. ZP32-5 TaxID=2883245 RepID=UPI001F28DE43|nr:AraC family transcriptional regulator [Paraburkholderia sp. ZP32-5]
MKADSIARSIDIFEGIAPLLRARPIIDELCRFDSEWARSNGHASVGQAWFHIVVRGSCVVEQVSAGPLTIETGDVLLLPHGNAHVIGSAKSSTTDALAAGIPNALRQPGPHDHAPDTEIICGRLEFDTPGNPVLAVLPDLLVMHSGDGVVDRLSVLLTAIRDELDEGRVGGRLIATELASVLFLMLLRLHLEESPPTIGLVRLLGDQVTSRVVTALINDFARNWTLDELAAVADTSRATLVRSFRRVSGQTPLAFATDLRLDFARMNLLRTKDSIAAIAAQAGYQSEHAFSRAMVRRFGIRPGLMRSKE